jgi:hypothetical protein
MHRGEGWKQTKRRSDSLAQVQNRAKWHISAGQRALWEVQRMVSAWSVCCCYSNIWASSLTIFFLMFHGVDVAAVCVHLIVNMLMRDADDNAGTGQCVQRCICSSRRASTHLQACILSVLLRSETTCCLTCPHRV